MSLLLVRQCLHSTLSALTTSSPSSLIAVPLSACPQPAPSSRKRKADEVQAQPKAKPKRKAKAVARDDEDDEDDASKSEEENESASEGGENEPNDGEFSDVAWDEVAPSDDGNAGGDDTMQAAEDQHAKEEVDHVSCAAACAPMIDQKLTVQLCASGVARYRQGLVHPSWHPAITGSLGKKRGKYHQPNSHTTTPQSQTCYLSCTGYQ